MDCNLAHMKCTQKVGLSSAQLCRRGRPLQRLRSESAAANKLASKHQRVTLSTSSLQNPKNAHLKQFRLSIYQKTWTRIQPISKFLLFYYFIFTSFIYFTVKTFLKQSLGFDHDFLPLVVFMQLFFILLFVFIFGFGIKYLNYQKR